MIATYSCPHCSTRRSCVVEQGDRIRVVHDCPAKGMNVRHVNERCSCGLPLAGDPRRHDPSCAFRKGADIAAFVARCEMTFEFEPRRPVF